MRMSPRTMSCCCVTILKNFHYPMNCFRYCSNVMVLNCYLRCYHCCLSVKALNIRLRCCAMAMRNCCGEAQNNHHPGGQEPGKLYFASVRPVACWLSAKAANSSCSADRECFGYCAAKG